MDLEQGSDTLVEAVVAPESSLEQKIIGEVNFLDRFEALVLAIRRKGKLQQEVSSDLRLFGGDSLLLSISKDRVSKVRNDVSFAVASEAGLPHFHSDKILVVVAIMAGVVLAAAFNLLSGFFFLSVMLTSLISSQATAALLAPNAVETTSAIEISSRPLLFAVTYLASLSFMTPVDIRQIRLSLDRNNINSQISQRQVHH